MIRSIRAFFLSRVLREKLLLVCFLGIGVVMWASSLSSRGNRFWRAQNVTTAQLKEQDFWLGRQKEIETITQTAAAQMDPAKTLDPTNLSVTVSQLANDAGLKITRSNVTPAMSTGQFSINALRITINGADWSSFSKFYQRLQQRAPYLAITELAIQPMRGNPSQVQGTMNISSFEVKH